MAKLAIYNGKALDREVELPEGTLRIGRSDQNDIVLSDASKAVSRFHAELRVEKGQFTIADLNSQNGTWVAGRRVQQANVAPGTAMLLGTYRLVVSPEEKPDRAAAPAMVLPAAQPEPLPAPVSARPAVAPPPPASSTLPAAAPAPSSMTPDISPLPARERAPARPVNVKRPNLGKRVATLAAACLCLILTGFAAGVFWWPSSVASPVAGGQSPAEPQAVLGGPPTETPLSQVSSEASIQPAAAVIAPVPAAAAGPIAGNRPADTASARKDAAAASKVGAEPKTREQNAEQVLERARSAVKKGDYTSALAGLESILRVDAGNPDALDLLASLRAKGQDAFKSGRQFDAAGRPREAAAMYEKTVKLLPPDHPSARAARERLSALRQP